MNKDKLRVWWIPQVPGGQFIVPVDNLEEANLLLDVLADYDRFQYENNIKPDYSNAGGLEMWDEDEQDWREWENEGEDFDSWRVENLKRRA